MAASAAGVPDALRETAPGRPASGGVERTLLLEAAASLAKAQEAQARLAGALDALLHEGSAPDFQDAQNGSDVQSPRPDASVESEVLVAAKATMASGIKDVINHDEQPFAGSLASGAWPASLQIRWDESMKPACVDLRGASSTTQLLERMGRSRQAETPPLDAASHARFSMQRFVILHTSRTYMLYGWVSCFLLLFDVVVVPWMIAWDVPLLGFQRDMAWVTTLFWTADICASFITTFHQNENDELIDHIPTIAKRYLRSYFVIDVIIITGDWVSLFLSKSAGWRVARLAKIGRLLRLVVLIRVLKAPAIVKKLGERLSDYSKLALRFANMFVITVSCTHIISCAWFFIGRSVPSDTGMSWIRTSDYLTVAEESMWYQYTTSFHWAMAQLCLGSNEVVCTTSVERMFSVMCMVVGLLFGSTLVSTLSTAMFQVQMDHRDNHVKLKQMKTYLHENQIDSSFAADVQTQLRARLVAKDRVKEGDVYGLKLLSSAMQAKLRYEVFVPRIEHHSLFNVWVSVDRTSAEHFIISHMKSVHLMRKDDLFSSGKRADCAYVLVTGGLNYTQYPEHALVDDIKEEDVKRGGLISEATLWCHWFHVGTSQATQFCDVAEVRATGLQDAARRSEAIFELCREYCEQFHRRLQAAGPPTMPWPDDLQVPLTEWGDMVSSMSGETKSLIGLDAIHKAGLGTWSRYNSLAGTLTTEILSGASIVVLEANCELRRIVSLVALRIRNRQGQLLIELGRSRSGTMTTECRLPGGKQHQGELVMDSLHRLLETKMASIASNLETVRVDREVETKQSEEYHIRTKYFRNVVHMSYTSGLASMPSEGSIDTMSPVALRDLSSSGSISPKVLQHRSIRHRTIAAAGILIPQASRDGHLPSWAPVVMKSDKNEDAVYAWLTEVEFRNLQRPGSKELISRWLNAAMARLHEANIYHYAEDQQVI
ncbi:unnamed protein product [Prorocentrum cordatum]|uniref:Cyclic nucleotide-binding domain-containing protein n=1 Tax=Prorocentrum cordatum TaxID=2364126 RepID=A0ABN9TNR1_9DINO|nr:unnamed protein product [Polarella glacialis]